jgi:hypothetical protein
MRGPVGLVEDNVATFRPSVTLTALLISPPRNKRSRASDEKRTSLADMMFNPHVGDRRRQAAFFFVALASITPMTSDSFMIKRSSPSILTSVPDHFRTAPGRPL